MGLLLQSLSVLPGGNPTFCGRRAGAMCAESLQCMASVGDPWGSTQSECSPGRCWTLEAGWPDLTAAGQRLQRCLYCTYVVGGDCSPSAAGYLCLDKLPLSTGFPSLPYTQWAQYGLRSISLPHVCPPQTFPLPQMVYQVVGTLLALSSRVSFSLPAPAPMRSWA